MSKEILEKALQATVEKEKKAEKQVRLAESLGKTLGITAALALDNTIVWLVLVYLCGISMPWTAALGWTLLVYMVVAKIRK